MQRMRDSTFQRSFVGLGLTVGGGALGVMIILFGYPFPEGSASQRFVQQPGFVVWLILIGVLTALLTLFAVPLWLSLRSFKEHYTHNKLDTIISTVIIALLFIAPSPLRDLGNVPTPDLQYHSEKVGIILLFGLFTTMPAWVGILLIRMASQSAFAAIESTHDETAIMALVNRYLDYRRALQRYITILGVLVGLLTLATGALRSVQISAGMPESEYPIAVVLVYGLYYTVVLALIYTPTYVSLLDAGSRLRDRIYPLDSLPSLIENTEKRAKMDEVLQLNVRAEHSLRAGIAILAPLLSGLFSSLLDLKL